MIDHPKLVAVRARIRDAMARNRDTAFPTMRTRSDRSIDLLAEAMVDLIDAVAGAPAPKSEVASDIERDARRYRRLRILGVAPDGSQHLLQGTVLRVTNLDAFVDHDLSVHRSRGEAE